MRLAEIAYKCPACGAPIDFDIQTQQMRCQYCGGSFDVATVEQFNAELGSPEPASGEPATQESMDPQSSQESAPLPETISLDPEGKSVPPEWESQPERDFDTAQEAGMSQFICNSCGGEIIGSPDMVSARCPYCDNNFVAISQLTSTRVPDYVIPFTKTKEDAKAAFAKATRWLPFLPRAFKQRRKIEEITGMYLPFWLYDADVAAAAVFNATKIATWRDGEWEYTRTDHYRVERSGAMAFEAIPVAGSNHVKREYSEAIEPYDRQGVLPFGTAYLTGFLADKYNVPAEDANEQANRRMKRSAMDVLRETTREYQTVTTQSKNIQIDNGRVHYAFLPTWLLTVRYADEVYTFLMNGQTGRIVGEFPSSTPKMIAFFGISTAVLWGIVSAFVFQFIL